MHPGELCILIPRNHQEAVGAIEVDSDSHRKLMFTLSAFIKPWSTTLAADGKSFLTCTMRASTTISPYNGLEKISAGLFIRKSFSELVNVHNIFLLSWGRYYKIHVTVLVAGLPFFVYSSQSIFRIILQLKKRAGKGNSIQLIIVFVKNPYVPKYIMSRESYDQKIINYPHNGSISDSSWNIYLWLASLR